MLLIRNNAAKEGNRTRKFLTNNNKHKTEPSSSSSKQLLEVNAQTKEKGKEKDIEKTSISKANTEHSTNFDGSVLKAEASSTPKSVSFQYESLLERKSVDTTTDPANAITVHIVNQIINTAECDQIDISQDITDFTFIEAPKNGNKKHLTVPVVASSSSSQDKHRRVKSADAVRLSDVAGKVSGENTPKPREPSPATPTPTEREIETEKRKRLKKKRKMEGKCQLIQV